MFLYYVTSKIWNLRSVIKIAFHTTELYLKSPSTLALRRLFASKAQRNVCLDTAIHDGNLIFINL
jgi:hypothetical protein